MRNVSITHRTISRSSSLDGGRRPKTTWHTYNAATLLTSNVTQHCHCNKLPSQHSNTKAHELHVLSAAPHGPALLVIILTSCVSGLPTHARHCQYLWNMGWQCWPTMSGHVAWLHLPEEFTTCMRSVRNWEGSDVCVAVLPDLLWHIWCVVSHRGLF